MKTVNVVLVGVGGYGEVYVDYAFLGNNPHVNVVGVVDPYPEKCSSFDEFVKRNIPVYKSMEEFYNKSGADLALIATPIFLHSEQIITALENGSNVLCEKPLCADENDIERINKAQKESGKFVYIGYQWAYSEAITKLKKDAKSGVLGELSEMKTLVLRPRNREYFSRGVGWAGKISMPDGTMVYDSVANNSAAHYLFNMIYIMYEIFGNVETENIKAELMRANKIDNFDTSKIDFSMNGVKASFVAAHPVNKGIEPVFEYRFSNATVYYSSSVLPSGNGILPDEYTEFDNIVAVFNDGTKKVYGNPMEGECHCGECRKFGIAVNDVINGAPDKFICGVDSTSVHTRLINTIQKNFEITDIDNKYLKEENNVLYAEGLFESAVECYKNPLKRLSDFMK